MVIVVVFVVGVVVQRGRVVCKGVVVVVVVRRSRSVMFVCWFKRTTNHMTIYCMYCICNINITMAVWLSWYITIFSMHVIYS